MLNGFELHVYNRSSVYGHLERVFGLDPTLFPWDTSIFKGSSDGQFTFLAAQKMFKKVHEEYFFLVNHLYVENIIELAL